MDGRKQAVALRYHAGEDNAPVVLAKGKGVIAEAILELAEQAGVPSVADKELVGLLSLTEVGEAVPPEAYRLAAEAIAFVWRLDRKLQKRR